MKRLLVVLGILLLVGISAADVMPAGYPAGGNFYPDDYVYNVPIDNTTLFPVHANSASYITSLNNAYLYVYRAFPLNVVNYSTVSPPAQYMHLGAYAAYSDNVLYPIPSDVEIETSSADKSMTLYDPLMNFLWEAVPVTKISDTHYDTYGAYRFDLSNMTARPNGWTSGSASGLPMAPGRIRSDEILAGEIHHAISFSTETGYVGGSHVFPARHTAGSGTVPLGLRYRLKASFSEAPYQGADATSRAQLTIIHALKKYGAIVVDSNGVHAHPYMSLSADNYTSLWSSGDMSAIKSTDFEVIDQSWYIINEDSWQVRLPPTSSGETLPNADINSGHIPTSISGNAPITVQFTNISYNYPTSWMWGLKDVAGNNTWLTFATEENPRYTFGMAGNYLINLTAGNRYGYNVTPEVAWVNVTALGIVPPISEFTSDVVTGPDPLTVHFTDMSTNATGWNWSFGDGTYSDSQDPMHVFSAGVYTISLLVTNAGGSDTETKGAYIYTASITPTPTTTLTPTPTPTPTGNWTATPTPTPSPTPTPAPVLTTGPQILTPVTGINSNGANFTISGVTGSDVWLVYGQNPGGYTWITPNTTATSGWATIWLSGSPLFGNTLYYVQACDRTGCGNEVSFSTLPITPMPTTTYGAGYKAITGMR